MHVADAVVISLKGVSKIFQTEEIDTHALSRVNIKIRKGEFVAIEGPSGCGKSTLLTILGLLDTATEGDYELSGQRASGLNSAQRAELRNTEIGFIFQSFNLIGDLTVLENVELPLVYRRGVTRGERRKAAMIALERVGMSHRLNHYPVQLSGGQQQRVAVARALVGQPAVLLADEPTGNLDSNNGETVMELLRELHAGGATICMVTHDPRYANAAQRRIKLHDGKVVDEATPAH